MKITALHRITALSMAFLMFFTSIGYSVNVHYCKGEFKSFSLIGKASSCHQTNKTCPRHKKMISDEYNEESKCCSNETIVVNDLDVDYDISSAIELTDFEFSFVTAFVYTFNGITTLPNVVYSEFPNIDDPSPPRDIYVLLERFLI